MSTKSPAPSTPPQVPPKTADGNLIGLLTAGFYILFTLLPSSHSLMVSWPWVAVWQVALVLPIIWLLWQMWFKPLGQFKLGSGLDWPFAILVMGLGISTLFAEFPNQALWYSWAALGGIAAIYALSGWIKTPQQAMRLLRFQAILGITFICLSLGLWLFQTYLPELDRLAALEPYGVSQQFNFGVTSLRNWYPLGHQNYVAGYLVLILPLLFGLGITDKGWPRWLWFSSCCLGLVDLYTASSRGGLMALVLTVAIALVITLFRSQLSRRLILPAGCLLLCMLIATTLGNSRVRRPLWALLQGKTSNSELGYRIINNVIGWRIGIDHPFTGAGPGSVFQLYQKYRPYWAGRDAELHFQLHSTPAQLWAELGIWGIAALGSLIGVLSWLIWHWASQRQSDNKVIADTSEMSLASGLVWNVITGLAAYTLMGLTDYQLDLVPISGVLIVYFVVLAKTCSVKHRNFITNKGLSNTIRYAPTLKIYSRRLWIGLGIGCLLVVNLWLIPVHRAWALSKQGFNDLDRGDFDSFEQKLTQAHQLTPWEPYYVSMLAWVLGDFSYQTTDATNQILRDNAIQWFEEVNEIAPYQEFSQSNLGWLLLAADAAEAKTFFTQSAQLVPAKQGVFWGLGVALLANNQKQQAVDALALEILRFPIVITSPIWQIGEFKDIREDVWIRLEQIYSELLDSSDVLLVDHWQKLRGALYWWQGDYQNAIQDWQNFPTGQTLLQLAQGEKLSPESLDPSLIGRNAFLAWLNPDQRPSLLEQAAIDFKNELPKFNNALPDANLVDQMVSTMNEANSFDDWLKENGLISQPRSQRLGFGTLYRHIDGPFPSDYYTRVVNQPVAQYFLGFFWSHIFFPELDHSLQPYRDRLLETIHS